MAGRPIPGDIWTRVARIAELAREDAERSFLNLAHYIDIEWLREAYGRVRKDGAVGVDGQTGEEYGQQLESNLVSLLGRFKSGSRNITALEMFVAKAAERKMLPQTIERKLALGAFANVAR